MEPGFGNHPEVHLRYPRGEARPAAGEPMKPREWRVGYWERVRVVSNGIPTADAPAAAVRSDETVDLNGVLCVPVLWQPELATVIFREVM